MLWRHDAVLEILNQFVRLCRRRSPIGDWVLVHGCQTANELDDELFNSVWDQNFQYIEGITMRREQKRGAVCGTIECLEAERDLGQRCTTLGVVVPEQHGRLDAG